MTGLVFLALFYSITFLYQNVIGFLLIAKDYLSVMAFIMPLLCHYYGFIVGVCIILQ